MALPFFDIRALQLGTILVPCTFTGNGTSSPVAANTKGKNCTVTRTGTGLYTITFSQKYNECTSATHAWIDSAGGALNLIILTLDPTTAGTCTIKVTAMDGATATDIPTTAKLSLLFVMRNSSL